MLPRQIRGVTDNNANIGGIGVLAMMTKKHFKALAKVLHNSLSYLPEKERKTICSDIAWICAADNPNFNSKKFYDACEKGIK
jgi:hypothetical protein